MRYVIDTNIWIYAAAFQAAFGLRDPMQRAAVSIQFNR